MDTLSRALKHRIAEIWDSRAATYDPLYGHGLRTEREHEAWLRLLSRLLPPEKPLRVLDVGVGTGFLAFLVCQLGHHVVGIDFSDRMLAAGRSKLRNDCQHVDFAIADGESLPFASGSFDAVINRAVLWTLLQPATAVSEWSRVTRPGGLVVSIDGIWVDRIPLIERIGKYLIRISSNGQGKQLSYDKAVSDRLPLRKTPTIRHATNIFLESGLCNVITERLPWIDAIEKESMKFSERVTYRYQRYLVAGTRPDAAPRGAS